MTGTWTEARVERLKVLYDRGDSFGAIAMDLGVTRCSAIGKAHRLYFPKRESPKASPRPHVPRAPRLRIVVRAPKPTPQTRLERALAVAVEPGRDYRCTINELRDGTCRYPLWGLRHWANKAKLYCGAPGASLSSARPYCPAHTEFCGGRRTVTPPPRTNTQEQWPQNLQRSSAR